MTADGSQIRPEAPGTARRRRTAPRQRLARGEVALDELDADGLGAREQRLGLRERVGVDHEHVRRDFEARRASSMPSATAEDSSSIDAFAVSRPVSSETMVWKLISASSRPCEISG
jgi:hypothetical protein